MQSRRGSIFEVTMNIFTGFIVSWILTYYLMLWFGYSMTVSRAWSITSIYTVVSIIRSYFWRRIFNKFERKV
jgi:hypothetical protein